MKWKKRTATFDRRSLIRISGFCGCPIQGIKSLAPLKSEIDTSVLNYHRRSQLLCITVYIKRFKFENPMKRTSDPSLLLRILLGVWSKALGGIRSKIGEINYLIKFWLYWALSPSPRSKPFCPINNLKYRNINIVKKMKI